MIIDYGLDKRQAQTCAALLAVFFAIQTLETVEQFGNIFARNTAAVILNPAAKFLTVPVQPNLDGRPSRAVFNRIGQQIHQHTLQQGTVAQQPGFVNLIIRVDLCFFIVGLRHNLFYRSVCDEDQIDLGRLIGFTALGTSQLQEILGQIQRFACRLTDIFQPVWRQQTVGRGISQLGDRNNRDNRRAQIVRHEIQHFETPSLTGFQSRDIRKIYNQTIADVGLIRKRGDLHQQIQRCTTVCFQLHRFSLDQYPTQ